MKKRKRLLVQICLLSLGLVLVSFGILLMLFYEDLHEAILREAMAFHSKSEAYKAWRKNDPPLDMEIYLFNWTNPEDIKNLDTKPKFEKIGPYRFKELREKINVTWNDNNTISYRHKKFYFYNEESERKLNDTITILNMVPLTISYKARHLGYFNKRIISFSLSSMSKLHMTGTAGKILFDGVDEGLLRILSTISLGNVQDKFGLFYGRNGSSGYDGSFSMYYDNDERFGEISRWNFRNTTDFFSGHCNEVKGSAGEFYPFNRKKDKIVLYSPELCRYANFEFDQEIYIKGILGYRYTGKYIFDNGTERPENACFCNGECQPSGVFNVSVCREGSPTFLSFSNFYAADPYYTDAIEGVTPDETDEFYIVLEPKTGIVIDISAQMQINMLLQPVEGITIYQDVPKIYFPIFYFAQRVLIPDDLAIGIRILQIFPEICSIASLVMLGLGTVMLVWLLLLIYCNRDCSSKSDIKKPYEEIPLRS